MDWHNITFSKLPPIEGWSTWRRCRVAGTSHRDEEELASFLMSVHTNDRLYGPAAPHVWLEREPDNAHDPRAVAVWGRVFDVTKGWFKKSVSERAVMLGYVPTEMLDDLPAGDIRAQLKDGALGTKGKINAFALEIIILRPKVRKSVKRPAV